MRGLIPFRRDGGNQRAPVTVFDTLQREVDRLFDDFSRGLGPASGPTQGANLVPNMDVTESGRAIEVSVELPGLEQSDVDITITDNVLTISGEKSIEDERDERNARVVE